MKICAVENELNRLRLAAAANEDHLLELERRHQENRGQNLKLMDTITELEHKIQEYEANLNAEKQSRKRVESRLQSLENVTQQETNVAESMPAIRLSVSESNASKPCSAGDCFQRVSSPIRSSTFSRNFEDERDLAGEALQESKPEILRVDESSKMLKSSSLRTPDRKKTKISKSHVTDVRETVAAARHEEDVNAIKFPSRLENRDEYELSIERTQQFIRQRLGGKGVPGPAARVWKLETPKRSENTDSVIDNMNIEGISFPFRDGADLEDSSSLSSIQVPKLRPASPPIKD